MKYLITILRECFGHGAEYLPPPVQDPRDTVAAFRRYMSNR
jgi:hypothetical protein